MELRRRKRKKVTISRSQGKLKDSGAKMIKERRGREFKDWDGKERDTERQEMAKMHLTEGQKDSWRQDKGL